MASTGEWLGLIFGLLAAQIVAGIVAYQIVLNVEIPEPDDTKQWETGSGENSKPSYHALNQGLLNQMIFTYYISSTSTTSVSEALETSWVKRLVFVVFFLWATGFSALYFYFFKRKFKRNGNVFVYIPVRYFQILRLISGATWVVSGIGIAAVGPNTEARTHNLLTAATYVSYSVTELCCITIRSYDTYHFTDRDSRRFQPSFARFMSVEAWRSVRIVLLALESVVLAMAWISIGLFFGAPNCNTTCRNTWEYVSVGMVTSFVFFFVLE